MLMNVEKDLTDSVTVDEDKQYSTKDFSVYAKLLKVLKFFIKLKGM